MHFKHDQRRSVLNPRITYMNTILYGEKAEKFQYKPNMGIVWNNEKAETIQYSCIRSEQNLY